MDSKKTRFLLNKRLGLWLLGAVSVFALMTVSADFLDKNVFYKTALSADSIQILKQLNYEYNFKVSKQLVAGEKHSDLLSELSVANILDDSIEAKKSGLIVTLDSLITEGGMILLKSPKDIPIKELKTIAAKYDHDIPEFENVEIDQTVNLEGYPVYHISTDYGVSSSISEVELASERASNRKVRVAVIDSGIDTEHEIFKKVTLEEGWNTIDNNSEMYDDVGHGTHMAGIIAQNAPGVRIIPYKIAGESGGELSNVLMAFQKAIDDNVNIVNASFGVGDKSYALEKLVQKAKSKGIIIVAAAGNNDTSGPFYPAEFSESIAVASLDLNGSKMPRSNYGYWVDLAAIGEKVYSALPGGAYGYKNGTSPATAYVTGQIANLMKKDGILNASSIVSYFAARSKQKINIGELAGVTVVK